MSVTSKIQSFSSVPNKFKEKKPNNGLGGTLGGLSVIQPKRTEAVGGSIAAAVIASLGNLLYSWADIAASSPNEGTAGGVISNELNLSSVTSIVGDASGTATMITGNGGWTCTPTPLTPYQGGTLAFWIADAAFNKQIVIQNSNGGGSTLAYFALVPSAGNLILQYCGSDDANVLISTWNGLLDFTGPEMFALAWDGVAEPILYRDGVAVAPDSTGEAAADKTVLYSSDIADMSVVNLAGNTVVQNVRFYDYGLSQAEVLTLFNEFGGV